MANIVPFAFKGELASGTHNFASGGNTFKIALYTSNPYTTSSTAFTATNEVSSSGGSNYPSGGKELTSQTVTATFAAIYNTSASNKLCVVLDFGGNKTATNGTFTISYPDPSTPSNAIISITS